MCDREMKNGSFLIKKHSCDVDFMESLPIALWYGTFQMARFNVNCL